MVPILMIYSIMMIQFSFLNAPLLMLSTCSPVKIRRHYSEEFIDSLGSHG